MPTAVRVQVDVERDDAIARLARDAQAAWEDYQATGLHLTGEEVFAWLETWGTDQDAEMPACHT